jgi:anti-sigma factor RsiW
MTCAMVRELAERYAAGTLSPAEAAGFEAHLGSCPACEARLLEQSPVASETAGLARSIEPAADLWPAIEGRIARREASRRLAIPRWALAAAAVLLVAISSGVTALLLRPDAPAATTVRGVSALEVQYAEVSEELAGALEAARPRLRPETMATIERSLRIIDAALEESRRALALDPGNPVLGQIVVAAWRQKVDLLRRATELGAES